MAIENITKRIISDAEVEANQITKEAQKQASDILTEAKLKAKENRDNLIKKAEEELFLYENKELVRARIDARNTILQEKQSIVNEAFEKAHQALFDLDKNKYKYFLQKLIFKLSDDGDEILFSDKDSLIGKEIIEKFNEEGKKIRFSDEKIDIDGGFIIKKDGIETICSLKAIIENQRHENEKDLTNILFN